ncbi:MAG: DUF1016 domain-containing protein [Lewinellaceae bacterium]|nr:DUF1016 family protein [Saprospiraceae bacterium]MCB9339720.1 DUF1016 domain-containing protein [Lewinellaceae bacterium]
MIELHFEHISRLIEEARQKAYQFVNKELIELYWKVGEYISFKVDQEGWGQSTVQQLPDFIKARYPELKGFTRRGLYRMKQFYETYKNVEIVSSLMTQISWTHHINILASTQSIEEKEFYIRLAIKDQLSVRELRRQMDTAYFERAMLADKKLPLSLKGLPREVFGHFKDTYVFEFLNLPDGHSELDLKKALLSNLKKFILEFGKDFTLVGEEYRLQVGMKDYSVDLLFFHRELQCLVPVELKIEEFQPEFLGKLNFYLEALDRDVKKQHEKPSIGVLLCKGKDEEVVEYALNRNLSPAMIADYQTKLIDKEILRKKLHELFEMEEEKARIVQEY